ncbi:SusD/RagB family nutrient-binding outer membrane lipoprotein [Persicobacter diffluens]|uniref:SusD/RagB family nutrient-binding outer membrane lipoprotein n=1 Tax=Persicobacter diffluens TaxID=981 RepID=A0AAN5AN58_9BACT|nr:hypothetical protein PEDI_35930 [Persicobacter diffluens]
MKSFSKNIKALAAGFALSMMAACTAGFEDANTNPYEPEEVPTSYLMTNAQKTMMDLTWDEWQNARMGMLVSQFWAQNDYPEESHYDWGGRASMFNNTWNRYYARPLRDFKEIIDLLSGEEAASYVASGAPENQIAVATILRVWVFQNLTDIWGPVPYTEALKGDENKSPEYDSQEFIYKSLLEELADAVAMIDEDQLGMQGDLVFGGDMAKWRKFGNSLRLRMAMRISDVDAATAKTNAEAAIKGGLMTSNDDSAIFPYLNAAPNQNPLYDNRINGGRNDFAPSEALIEVMNTLNDPRRPMYATKATTGEFAGQYKGMTYGLTRAAVTAIPLSATSQPSDEVEARADAPGFFLKYDEVEFNLAHAKELGWAVDGSAAEHYYAGIEASLEAWGVNSLFISAYLAEDGVAYDAADWRQSIGVQKWLAQYMQGQEGWSTYRQYDFRGVLYAPVEQGAFTSLANSAVPTRWTYPADEGNLNKANMDAGAAMLDEGDKLFSKMWWDLYPAAPLK